MDLTKVLEMLQANKLEESAQAEIKNKLETIIESKAQSLVAERIEKELEAAKDALTEELESKFETYKDEVTSKFSNFVDSILDEEVKIPEKVVEYAKLGELYHDLIEQFKIRLAIDEGALNNEVQSLLKEAKNEIIKLKEDCNKSTKKVLTLEQDAQEMAAHIYLRKKCDGLTESQKSHVISILGDETVKESIDKKFGFIIESMDIKKITEEDEPKDDKGDVSSYTCEKCGASAEIKEGDDLTCPECGEKMTLTEKKGGKKVEEGKGHVEVGHTKSEKPKMNEGTGLSPWELQKKQWIELNKRN
jgi:DNA-directed RNA polymerase subunit RPC12/RpoP